MVSVKRLFIALPARPDRRGEPSTRLHVPGYIKIHQTVGGANLDLRVDIAERADQRVQAVLSADVDNRLHRFETHIEIGIGEIRGQFRDDRRSALLAVFANGFCTSAGIGMGILRGCGEHTCASQQGHRERQRAPRLQLS